ncbi:MAG: hypothetical protein M3Y87_08930 [Myxococcota bacterium]|nr:hypothetical protein [Myxococcota bacterium]
MAGRHIAGTTVALALALGITSCDVRTTGEAQRLAFTYDSDEAVSNLSRPIATGGRIELRVEDVLTATPLPIDSATSDSDAIVVRGIEDGAVIVDAVSPGAARIAVTATLRDELVSDSIVLESRPAERVELAHACAGGESGVYLTGSRIRLPFELSQADGTELIGHGVHPVSFSPAGRLVIDESSTSQAFLPLHAAQLEGVVTIASTIDDARLELELIDEGRLEGAELLGGSIDNAVGIGETRFSFVAPTYDGRRLCQGDPEREITTWTPSTCEVSPIMSAREDDPRQGMISIRGMSQGTCRFSVRYPNAAAGAGVEVELSVPVR